MWLMPMARTPHDSATEYKGKTTIEYNFNTGLELFGHKVDVWYDWNTDVGHSDHR